MTSRALLTAFTGVAALAAAGAAFALWPRPAASVAAVCPASGAQGREVWVPGGTFAMGSADFYPEEAPVRTETVAGFWMDATEVTNAQFAAFVAATGYVTVAERTPADPSLPPEQRVPGAAVFTPPAELHGWEDIGQWWRFTPGASWRAPAGPGSSIAGRENDPVVHIAVEDAEAYAAWKGRALPTEAQWEFAARGGLDGAPFVWGAAFAPDATPRANTWEGVFPLFDGGKDGFAGRTAPAGCFAPNGYGLHDMAGNVWEWTRDAYAAHAGTPPTPSARTIKGGSYLCAPNFCGRYRPAARQPGDPSLGASHIGFRTVRNAPGP